MKKSIITQKLIAKAFKNCLAHSTFNQITVSDIMQAAKIRRQTFYNYFQSKEELLNWIFENQFSEVTLDNFDYYNWKNELYLFLRYLEDNLDFYHKILFIDADFDKIYLKQCEHLIYKVLSDQTKISDLTWSDNERFLIYQYNSFALHGISKSAILKNEPLTSLYPTLVTLLESQFQEYKPPKSPTKS